MRGLWVIIVLCAMPAFALAQNADPAISALTGQPAAIPAPAWAQLAPAAPPEMAQQRALASDQKLAERFYAANSSEDGHLTRAQAEDGGMPMVARHFDDIDADHLGYVTLDEIEAWRRERAAQWRGGS